MQEEEDCCYYRSKKNAKITGKNKVTPKPRSMRIEFEQLVFSKIDQEAFSIDPAAVRYLINLTLHVLDDEATYRSCESVTKQDYIKRVVESRIERGAWSERWKSVRKQRRKLGDGISAA